MIDLHNALIAGRMIGGNGGSPAPEPTLITKSITANGVYSAEDDNADGYSAVSVEVPEKVLTTKTMTENGTYAASSDNADGYSAVTVNVPTPPHSCYLSVLDPDAVLLHYEITTDGGIAPNNEWYVTDYVDIRDSSKLIKDFHSGQVVCFYDANKNFISYARWSATDWILVANMPSGTKYFRTNGMISYLSSDMILLHYPNGYPPTA